MMPPPVVENPEPVKPKASKVSKAKPAAKQAAVEKKVDKKKQPIVYNPRRQYKTRSPITEVEKAFDASN